MTSKETEVLTIIKELLERGDKPKLKNLSALLWEKLNPMGLDAWAELEQLLMEHYKLSAKELRERFKPPLLRGSDFVDTFKPVFEGLDIGGWLGDYVLHTMGMEAPTAYHFFSALTVMSAALKRNTFVDMAYFQVLPTLRVILVGPSQQTCKSTASGYAVNIGLDSGTFVQLMDEGSTEAMKSELADLYRQHGYAAGLTYISELSTFFGDKDYNRDFIKVMTDLFDDRASLKRRTQKDGVVAIKHIAVCFLGCSNEAWLRETMPESVIGGGLMARVLPIHQTGTDRCAPIPRLLSKTTRQDLIQWLKKMTFIQGQAHMSDDAVKLYEDTYRRIKTSWPEDERLHPFWAKMPIHLLKISMLLSVNDDPSQRGQLLLTEKHVLQSQALLDWIYGTLPHLYAHLGMSEFGGQAMELLTYIQRAGGRVSEGDVYRKFVRRLSRAQISELLNLLVLSKHIASKPSVQLDGKCDYILIRDPKDL